MMMMVMSMLMVMVMSVAVIVAMAAGLVTAGLRLESALDDVGAEAELVHQAIEHVVVLVRQASWLNLERHVAITQMIRGTRQQMRITRFDDGERLWPGSHLDHELAVARRQTIAVFERKAALEQEAHFGAAIEPSPQAGAPSQLERQRQCFGRPALVRSVEHDFQHLHGFLRQNRKYFWASGSSRAGSHTKSSPSARTS
jgi:hypothetical protein